MTAFAEARPQGPPGTPVRSEPRQQTVHVVEYSRYPRRSPDDTRRVAYTQDRSATGLGLDLGERLFPGELLQITLRDIDGEHSIDGLARVVWCREAADGRAHAGLAMMREKGERPMMRVRRTRKIGRTRREGDRALDPDRVRAESRSHRFDAETRRTRQRL